MTARRHSAISLGELGAVVAVTCVVLAVAYSAYRTQRVKGEVAEGIVVASELIPTVTELFRRHGEVPPQLDVPPSLAVDAAASSVVESVTVVNGRIDVLYGDRADPAIAGRRLSLTPYETVDRSVVWICGNRIPSAGLEPLGFANGGGQALQIPTTIEPRYLSRSCR